jgi:uncharacterized membrane protein YeaQ/YmgE (transglycosylase-associated protein family)
MKSLGLALLFGIIGGFIGLFVAGGQLTQYKKSQRETAFPMLVIAFGGAGIVIGLIAGNRLSETMAEEKKFGFDNIERYKLQVGRKWEYETTFTNPATGTKNSIKTAYSKEHDTVLTYLNNVAVLNHESKSGADKAIEKNHYDGYAYVKKQISASALQLH